MERSGDSCACPDRGSQKTSFFPSRLPDEAITAYGLPSKGVYSRIWVVTNVPRQIRESSCVTSARKPPFAGRCENNTLFAFSVHLQKHEVRPQLATILNAHDIIVPRAIIFWRCGRGLPVFLARASELPTPTYTIRDIRMAVKAISRTPLFRPALQTL